MVYSDENGKMNCLRGAQRILIIMLRQIGDTLLIVPAIRAIRETFPHSHIAALVNSGTQEMLTGNPLLDEVIVFERSILKLPLLQRIKKELIFLKQIQRKKFDTTISLTTGDRAALLAFFSGASQRLAFDARSGFLGKRYLYTHRIKNSLTPMHAVERNLELVQTFGMTTNNYNINIFYSIDDERFVEEVFKINQVNDNNLKVHIHPVSNWLWNCWDDKKMAYIIDYLTAKYSAMVFMTCGPSTKELEKFKSILRICKHKPVDLSSRTTLKQLAALCSRCDLFLGVNTAPMHIAAATKTKVIAFIGYGDVIHWRPWGDEHIVISEEKVRSDAYIGMQRPDRIAKSMDSITVDQVKRTLDHVLSDFKE